MSFKVRVDAARVMTVIQKMKTARDTLIPIMVHESDKVFVPAIRNQIRSNKSVFEGTLEKSVRTVIRGSNSSESRIEVGAYTPYASYIEDGRPAGVKFTRQEFGKLMRWVSRKLGASPPDNMRIANAIRTKLTAKGNKGKPFIKNVVEAERDRYTKRVAAAFVKQIRTF